MWVAMDLYKLKTFKTVAAFLNFNQAARYLNCAQSTVSNQIKSLEDEMGAIFFKRMGKKVQLTTAGEKMVGYANKLLSMEQEALADITGKNHRGSGKFHAPGHAVAVKQTLSFSLHPSRQMIMVAAWTNSDLYSQTLRNPHL
jgi:DNA-binding transcriptional LysR family regulator